MFFTYYYFTFSWCDTAALRADSVEGSNNIIISAFIALHHYIHSPSSFHANLYVFGKYK